MQIDLFSAKVQTLLANFSIQITGALCAIKRLKEPVSFLLIDLLIIFAAGRIKTSPDFIPTQASLLF